MITIEEAKKIVLSNCFVLNTEEIFIQNAIGFTLSSSVSSSINIPSFRQSSMDGYAIRLIDQQKELKIQDELPTGTSKQITLLPNCAIKVFTGGPIPDDADYVIPKENVSVVENNIKIKSAINEQINNIRIVGSEIKQGETAIAEGTTIKAMHIGFLASLGITKIKVIRKPSVAIIITGNEVVQPGEALRFGQIYESNSFALKACLRQLQISSITIKFAKDDFDETQNSIAEALKKNDVVLITGGVSVGDYDYVVQACLSLDVQQQFHGVKQRPGKPLFFGTKEKKLVFGLPGNPASVLSCFYQYVLPAIDKLSNTNNCISIKAKLNEPFEKKIPFTFFLKGFYKDGLATILSAQASFQQSAFIEANCWIELDENITHFEKNSLVKVLMFI